MSKPEQIKNIVKQVIGDVGEKKQTFEQQLIDNWENLVGTQAAGHTKPLKIQNGALFVLVDHPSWQVEFNTRHSKKVLEKIQKKFNEEKIKKIILTVGTF